MPPLPSNVTKKAPTSAPINCTWMSPERVRLSTVILYEVLALLARYLPVLFGLRELLVTRGPFCPSEV